MRWPGRRAALVLSGLACLLAVLYVGQQSLECHTGSRARVSVRLSPGLSHNRSAAAHGGGPLLELDEQAELVFVGGVPRSGTTLMRAMLDAHPAVRCGEETRVVPRLLAMREAWARSERERVRLDEAGVTERVLDDAVRAFILQIIAGHGEPAQRLCNKDPFALKSLVYLGRLFPRARFLLMLRDGRASVHSMISRKVTIAGFDLSSYRDCLSKWSRAIEIMYTQCVAVGSLRCLPVYYEQLVLQPEAVLRRVLRFLDVPWDDVVLRHEDMVGKAGGISLSKVERSTDQVVKPVNLEALTQWVGRIPEDVVRDMAHVAPMLSRLGYDPYANPPNYGSPDPRVLENTRRIKNGEFRLPQSLKRALSKRNPANASATRRSLHRRRIVRQVESSSAKRVQGDAGRGGGGGGGGGGSLASIAR
ncbi:protein-tyrosine sulfotransferase 1 isoform X2 [Petromyzon marinus]|uniref:protein-tyrosine sulfotransferase 1 isoform X2 n=1 Tax=Petromyzon marinus TaxID=7757 RepID=UPI003F709298